MKKIFTFFTALTMAMSMSASWWLNGSMNNWAGPELTGEGDVLSVSILLEGGKEYEFKLNNDGNWYGCNATVEGNVTDYIFYNSESANCKLKTNLTGYYQFTLKVSEVKLSITYPTEAAVIDYYITGTGNLVGGDGWKANEIKMTNNNGIYTHTFTNVAVGDTCLLKVTNGTWGQSWGFSAIEEAPAGVITDKDNNVKFVLAETGDVVVTFDGQKLAISGNFVATELVVSYALMGVKDDWKNGIALTQNPNNESEYMLLGQEIAEGDSVKVAKLLNGEAVEWCDNVKEESAATYTKADNGNIILQPGKYDFYYDINAKNIYIAASQPSNPSALDNVTTTVAPIKVIENGQLVIIKNGVKYSVAGAAL